MCRSLRYRKHEEGYSLIELSFAIIVVGLLLAPTLYLYSLYQKNQQLERTADSMLQSRSALDGFRAIYGRYPCPARMDATAGDVDYGYEFVDASGNCQTAPGSVEVATSQKTTLADRNIYIGSLPFREMNLFEEQVIDGYHSRLTYAVTGMLTDDTTYSNANGGITVVDTQTPSASVITPDHSAHFVILSHGANSDGAVTNVGSVSGICPAGTLEEENCDFDEVFRVGQTQIGFDDSTVYTIVDSTEQWQVSNTDVQDIHLRRSDSIAMGVAESDSTTGLVEAEVKEVALDDSVILAEADPANSLAGSFLSSELCDEDGTNCFDPELIAGDLGTGNDISCAGHPDGEFLVGIQNGAPVCSDEIVFKCPSNLFLSGFDANGNIVCDDSGGITCADKDIMTSCGDMRTISSDVQYNGFWYGYGYSGQCYRIDPLNTTLISGMSDINDVRNYIDGLNNAIRTPQDCGPDGSSGMVRDTYKCLSSATWDTNPVNTIERLGHNPFLNRPPLYNSSPDKAETNGVAYQPTNPMAADGNNNDWDHDCWCREDYTLDQPACGAPATGIKFRIRKHLCPRTDHRWATVYPSAGGWNYSLCNCQAGTVNESRSCSSYFGYSGNGITGNVIETYNVTCPDGSGGAPLRVLASTDTSNCRCPAKGDYITTSNCPSGKVNNFTFQGQNYINKDEIYKHTWSCPGGPAPVQPISSKNDAGKYSKSLVHTEQCLCDSTQTKSHTVSCPAGQAGTGIRHELKIDCSTGTFEAPSPANEVSRDCHACEWSGGSQRPGVSSVAAPAQKGMACSSCGSVSSCYVPVGSKSFKIYDGCTCSPKSN